MAVPIVHPRFAAALAPFLIHRVQWWPAANVDDGAGGYTQDWPARADTLACTVLDTPGEILTDPFLETPPNAITRTVVLAADASAPKPGDRLYWMERDRWLEVLPGQPPGTFGAVQQVPCALAAKPEAAP